MEAAEPGAGTGRGVAGKGTGRGVARPGETGQGRRNKGGNPGARSGNRPSRGNDPNRPRRPLADLLDYLRSCTRTLGEGLGNKEDEELLATRAIEEMGDRVLLVAADQRGSRPLERLLRKAGDQAFSDMFNTLMEAVPELAPNQYASHVLQSAFASWASRLGTAEAPVAEPPDAAPLVTLCKTLQNNGGWSYLVHNPCGSHVVRALILALGGYAPGDENRDRIAAKAGLLPEKKADVPAAVVECRRKLAGTFLALVREDDGLCLNAHASPVMQLLLRVLRDRGDRSLVADLAAAIVGAQSTGGAPSLEKCESLLQSAPGSRTFEAVLETSTAEAFSSLFGKFFRPRLNALVKGEAGDFGAFLAQRVADGLRDEPQLMLALAEVDFTACLKAEATPAQQAVAVKFAEACLRLRAGLKACAAEVFRALDLKTSSEFHRVWPTILALEHTESATALLRPSGKRKGSEGAEGAAAHFPPTLKGLPVAGPQLLGALLRFPADAVQPLNSGLPKILELRDVLGAMARAKPTARVLEGALAPASAILPKLRSRIARSFKGTLGELGPHPVGGWVCAALWRASLGEPALRASFAEELLAVEEALRAHNFAVWKVCGLHHAKVRKDEWSQQQEKAGKAKRLFNELMEGADPEEAKAAARARKQAAEDAADRAALQADPTLAGLLAADMADTEVPLVSTAAGKEDAEDDDDAKNVGDDLDSDAELDGLFDGKQKPWQKRAAKRRGKEATDDAAKTTFATGVKTANSVVSDPSLLDALELIAGKAPAKVRKSQKRKAAAAAVASDSDSDNADAAPPAAAAAPSADAPVVRKLKKRKKKKVTQ